jgi:hypothetical protein
MRALGRTLLPGIPRRKARSGAFRPRAATAPPSQMAPSIRLCGLTDQDCPHNSFRLGIRRHPVWPIGFPESTGRCLPNTPSLHPITEELCDQVAHNEIGQQAASPGQHEPPGLEPTRFEQPIGRQSIDCGYAGAIQYRDVEAVYQPGLQ